MSVVRLFVVGLAIVLVAGACTRKTSPEAQKPPPPVGPIAAGPVMVEYPPVDPNRTMAPALPPGSGMGVPAVTPAQPMMTAQMPSPMAAPAPTRRGRASGLPQIPSGAAPGTYGAHLASYSKESDAQRGWQVLQRSLGGQLGNLQPRMMSVDVKGRPMIRLFATGFESVDQARQLCESLRARQYCQVMPLG